jgi:stage II sporulation protein D
VRPPAPALVVLLLSAVDPRHAARTQDGVTDAELAAASRGRSVSIGSPAPERRRDVLPLELYVARVLAGEGEPGAPDAARQALAVAIRTFAVANAGRHRREGFDLCNTTHCQVLRAADPPSRRAALATAGRALAWEGRIAEVFYSASCGGRSESAADLWPRSVFPYLRSVIDDVHAGEAPWTLDLTLAEVRRRLLGSGFEGPRLLDVRVESHTGSGRVARLRLDGLRPGAVAGDEFRAAMGPRELRSTAFSLTRRGSGLRFTGRGYGHGVGLCVVGAGRRARRGATVDEILAHYYPGLEQVTLDSVRPAPAG